MRFKKIKLGNYGIIVILIILIVLFSLASSMFLKVENILNIFRQVSIVGIISVGMTFVLLTGGMDLAVGSVAGVAGVGAAILMLNEINPILACIIMLAAGLGLGIANGFIINILKVPPLIGTLGMMTALRGLAFIITGGLPVFGFSREFSVLGQGYVGTIPIPVIIMAVVFIVGIIVLNKTKIGRHVYGVGSNEEATRLSGVNVKRIKYIVYAMSGFLSSLAGIVLLSRINSGQPNGGSGYEMDVITAVVLGGVSISGGQGKLPFVIIGVLIMGVLTNGMTMLSINEYVQQLVKGLALVLAVAFDRLASERRKKQVVL